MYSALINIGKALYKLNQHLNQLLKNCLAYWSSDTILISQPTCFGMLGAFFSRKWAFWESTKNMIDFGWGAAAP